MSFEQNHKLIARSVLLQQREDLSLLNLHLLTQVPRKNNLLNCLNYVLLIQSYSRHRFRGGVWLVLLLNQYIMIFLRWRLWCLLRNDINPLIFLLLLIILWILSSKRDILGFHIIFLRLVQILFIFSLRQVIFLCNMLIDWFI